MSRHRLNVSAPLVAGIAAILATSVSAAPIDAPAIRKAAAASEVVKVGGFWWGFAPAFVGGAIVGGAIASAPYRYPYGPYYYPYGPGPYAYGPGPYPYGPPVAYGPGPGPGPGPARAAAPGYPPPPPGAVVATNGCGGSHHTFVGSDGVRHPCP